MSSSKKTFCFRILVAIFAALLWLIGATILGFSIYLRVDYWLNQYASAADEFMKYTVAIYIFIATGGVIVLFCVVGFYGAVRPDKLALVAYMIFLPLIFGMVVGGGIYAYVYSEQIENTITNSKLLTELVRKNYGINGRVTNAVDFMQKELGCCGGVHFWEYSGSVWETDLPEYRKDERKGKAPLTCCADYKRYEDIPEPEYRYCKMYLLDPGNTEDRRPENMNPQINKKGCGKAFVELIQKNLGVAAAIGFTIVAIIVLCMIVTGCLLFFMRQSVPARKDDVVYEMARIQEKSAYPSRGGPYRDEY